MTRTATATAPRWASHFTALALAELPADLATATPPQVDEVIRTVRVERRRNSAAVDSAFDALHNALGHERRSERVGTGRARRTVYTWLDGAVEVTGRDAEGRARTMDPATESRYYMRHHSGQPATIAEALAVLDAIRADDAEMHTVLARMTAEYTRRGGWTRYYRVANTGGHVHTDTNCRNTYATTEWTWPTQLSGATDAEVVGAAGRFTCLSCFPAVRAEILADRPIVAERFEVAEQTAERMEREQTNAARKAAKVAKGVTADGRPLLVRLDGYTAEVKTERAAELRYVEWTVEEIDASRRALALTGHENGAYWERKAAVYGPAAAEVAQALAAKRGVSVETLRESLAAKVTAKDKRDNPQR